jgi:hypothetical protein
VAAHYLTIHLPIFSLCKDAVGLCKTLLSSPSRSPTQCLAEKIDTVIEAAGYRIAAFVPAG